MNRKRTLLIGALAAIAAAVFLTVTPVGGSIRVPLPDMPRFTASHAPTPPSVINFQGVLTNPTTGNLVADGNYSLTFRVFDVTTGGTSLWTETQGSVPVSQGRFAVLLGSVTPFPGTLFAGTPRYLEVQVGTDPPLSPRQQWSAVPYAFHALTADSADTAENGVPVGASILTDSATSPPGFTLAGTVDTAGRWTLASPMPTARADLAAAAVNNKIYAIGGYNGTTQVANVEEYDPATNSWTTKASMPTARYGLAAAAVNNKIYAIGGYDGTSIVATVEEYDPATNTWATKASMPTARFGLAAAAVNNRIYAIGGVDATSTALGIVEEYDPATNTWATKASMPTARYTLAAAAVDNKIYAIGGHNGTTQVATVEQYDPATNSWTTKPSMATARSIPAAAAVNSKVYALGGSGGTLLAKVEEYDPATDEWGPKAPMPSARSGLAAAIVNNKIYAIGGYNTVGPVATVEEYAPTVTFYIHTKN